jgi:hypothetical protein
MIYDRDGKFSRDFDEVFRRKGVEIIRTAFRAPKANRSPNAGSARPPRSPRLGS